jgi:hypothetical protein
VGLSILAEVEYTTEAVTLEVAFELVVFICANSTSVDMFQLLVALELVVLIGANTKTVDMFQLLVALELSAPTWDSKESKFSVLEGDALTNVCWAENADVVSSVLLLLILFSGIFFLLLRTVSGDTNAALQCKCQL